MEAAALVDCCKRRPAPVAWAVVSTVLQKERGAIQCGKLLDPLTDVVHRRAAIDLDSVKSELLQRRHIMHNIGRVTTGIALPSRPFLVGAVAAVAVPVN